jgi:hypothetical protein
VRREVLGEQDRADDLGVERAEHRAAIQVGDRPVGVVGGERDR